MLKHHECQFSATPYLYHILVEGDRENSLVVEGHVIACHVVSRAMLLDLSTRDNKLASHKN